MDFITTATTSSEPIFQRKDLGDLYHVNLIGGRIYFFRFTTKSSFGETYSDSRGFIPVPVTLLILSAKLTALSYVLENTPVSVRSRAVHIALI